MIMMHGEEEGQLSNVQPRKRCRSSLSERFKKGATASGALNQEHGVTHAWVSQQRMPSTGLVGNERRAIVPNRAQG